MNFNYASNDGHHASWASVSKSLIDDLDANDTQTDYDQSSIVAPSETRLSGDEISEFDDDAYPENEEDDSGDDEDHFENFPTHACRFLFIASSFRVVIAKFSIPHQ